MKTQVILNKMDLSRHLEVSEKTIDRWRKQGMPFMKHGNTVRFDLEKVEAWLRRKKK